MPAEGQAAVDERTVRQPVSDDGGDQQDKDREAENVKFLRVPGHLEVISPYDQEHRHCDHGSGKRGAAARVKHDPQAKDDAHGNGGCGGIDGRTFRF